MAVIEYKMHRIQGSTRRHVPDWVGDRGHYMSPIDSTFIGWIDDERDYYVPDTVVSLTKEEFITRQLAIHAVEPFSREGDTPDVRVNLTNEEVTTQMGAWYDAFVAQNS